MSDTEKAIEIISDYESGYLSWEEAYERLLDVGTPEYVIKEAIGNEPT